MSLIEDIIYLYKFQLVKSVKKVVVNLDNHLIEDEYLILVDDKLEFIPLYTDNVERQIPSISLTNYNIEIYEIFHIDKTCH